MTYVTNVHTYTIGCKNMVASLVLIFGGDSQKKTYLWW
jgi:hypothetical protein